MSPRRYRNFVLAGQSYFFYFWAIPQYAYLLIVSTLIDYYCVKGMISYPSRKRILLWLSVFCNLGLLAYFKYANFFIDQVNALLDLGGIAGISFWKLVLPVGISFYTFQSLSYTIDIYYKRIEPARSLVDFFCYVSMFPQLVAGPIVRYLDIHEQLKNRREDWRQFSMGIWMFMIGFSKKVLIADNVAPLTERAFSGDLLHFIDAWVGLLAFTVELYFDFSGYSDMAIGLGMLFGFRLPVNFSSPYQATSVAEFWRCWHITLMEWLKTYLFSTLR